MRHPGGQRADRTDCRIRRARAGAVRGRASAQGGLFRVGSTRHRQGPSNVPRHERHAGGRTGLQRDPGVRYPHGFPLSGRLHPGNPRRFPAAARSFRGCHEGGLTLPGIPDPLPDQLLLHETKPGRYRAGLSAGQAPRGQGLVPVHDRADGSRRGGGRRTDLQGRLREDPSLALRSGDGGDRNPDAAHVCPPLLPDRPGAVPAGGAEMEAAESRLRHRRVQGLSCRSAHRIHRSAGQRETLQLFLRIRRQPA